MGDIIVVFPRREIAVNIRNILVRGGFTVKDACTTGAQAIRIAEMFDGGIIVSGYKLPDMLYTELREYIPETFEMLLIAAPDKWSEGEADGVMGLSMPIKVYDLLNTVDMMIRGAERRRKKQKEAFKNRNGNQEKLIQRAKQLLMERNNMNEEEAHRYLQKSSMNNGVNMAETAEMVLSVMAE